MTEYTGVNIEMVDGDKMTVNRMFKSIAGGDPSDADVKQFVDDYMATNRMGLKSVRVSRDISHMFGSSIVLQANSEVSAGRMFRVFFHKSDLVGNGGYYSMDIPEIKAALLATDKSVLIDNAVWGTLCEHFSDGAGLAGVQGWWSISEFEQMPEPTLTTWPVIQGGILPAWKQLRIR